MMTDQRVALVAGVRTPFVKGTAGAGRGDLWRDQSVNRDRKDSTTSADFAVMRPNGSVVRTALLVCGLRTLRRDVGP